MECLDGIERAIAALAGQCVARRVPRVLVGHGELLLLLCGWSEDFAAVAFMTGTLGVRFLSMTARADGFRSEGGAWADKAVALRSELGTPMVALGVSTGADHDDLLESEHGRSFLLNGSWNVGSGDQSGGEDGGLLEGDDDEDAQLRGETRSGRQERY
jgi:hypothetical protein